MFSWDQRAKGLSDCRPQSQIALEQTTLCCCCSEQPPCNNSGTGGLKGDSQARVGLQPTLVDAETSLSDRGKLKCNGCKASFPVFDCLCVQTSSAGNETMKA